MFCPKCGEAEQNADSFCRKCGELLPDSSQKVFLLSGLFGGSPERQINLSIFVGLTTALISGALMGFLLGFYDTEPATPTIIYAVYAFLTLIAFWQVFSVVAGLQLKSRFRRRNPIAESEPAIRQNAFVSADTRELLSEADTQNFVKSSVTENTTGHLKEKVPLPQTQKKPD